MLICADDYDSLIETLDMSADAALSSEIGAALAEARRGETYSLDEVRADMTAAGRFKP